MNKFHTQHRPMIQFHKEAFSVSLLANTVIGQKQTTLSYHETLHCANMRKISILPKHFRKYKRLRFDGAANYYC